jgi:signal transduction histidine kinase
MRISSLIFLGFSFILLLFAITTFINFRQSEKVKENENFLSTSTTIIRSSNRFQRNILNMGSGLRGFLLTGDDYFLRTYDSAALENNDLYKELTDYFPDTSEQHRLLTEIKQLNQRWLQEFASPLRQARSSAELSDGNIIAYYKLFNDKIRETQERELNIELQQKLRNFINLEYDRREAQTKILAQSVQQTRTISFTLTLTSIILAFIIVVFLTYRISRRILRMVNMADSIAAGNYEVHTEATGNDEVSRLAHSLNHMAQVLAQNINELKKKNEELDQFAHIVSHDMKAPLRGIDNVVTWMEEDHKHELSPKVVEYLDLIKGRTKRGENLIQGLLSYARVGKEESQEQEVDTRELLEEILDNFSLPPGMEIKIGADMPVLQTEKLPLLQVFSNLLSNAVKYNDKKNGLIEVNWSDRGDHFVFSIKDNGPGISKIYHEKIFAIFQTLQERDSFESTGVGLAIVKKILDARHEKISLSSEPGKGARFSFTWKK